MSAPDHRPAGPEARRSTSNFARNATITTQPRRHRQEHLPADPHQLVIAVARHDGLHHGEHEEEERTSWRPSTARRRAGPGSATASRRRTAATSARTSGRSAIYSPAMNSRYGVEEYSTMKPATSSDSASGRSKGGRLVSASAEMKNSTTIGRCGSQYQLNRPEPPCCASHDIAEVHRPGRDDDADDDQPQRHLVGNHLRRRAQRAEERVFRVRRPAAHDHAVNLERRDRRRRRGSPR